MKVNSHIAHYLRRSVRPTALTVATAVFLPALHAEEYSYIDQTITSSMEDISWEPIAWAPFGKGFPYMIPEHPATAEGNVVTVTGVVELPRANAKDKYDPCTNLSFAAAVADTKSGTAPEDADADNNTLIIRGSFITLAVGGASRKGNANGNAVSVYDSNLDDDLVGGASQYGNADNNVVTAYRTTLNALSGNSPGKAIGGWSTHGAANGNAVHLDDNTHITYAVIGGWGLTAACDNLVTIGKDCQAGYTAGGYTECSEQTSGDASRNTVIAREGAVLLEPVCGGDACNNLYISAGNAEDNLVIIEGAVVKANVYGGWAEGTGNADGNTVDLRNATTAKLQTTVYGGYASMGGHANMNTVYLREGDWSMQNTSLHGGYGEVLDAAQPGITARQEYTTYTQGNYLILDGFQGMVNSVDHFETYVFRPGADTDLTKPMLTLLDDEGKSHFSMVRDAGGTESPAEFIIDTSAIAGSLQPGTEIVLVGRSDGQESDGLHAVEEAQSFQLPKARSGLRSFDFDYEFDIDDQERARIIILGKEVKAAPEAKAIMEGRVATLELNNMAGNLVAEQAVDAACRAAEQADTAEAAGGKGADIPVARGYKDELAPGRRLFYVMNGGHHRVDSGSHVNVDGVNALLGIASDFSQQRALTLGAFVETGWGQYTTHNRFATLPQARGTGESDYVGGGVLLRYDFGALSPRLEGWSVDAAVRAGRQSTDYACADLTDGEGNHAAYEHDSSYIAGHVGVNYAWNANDRLTALFYARYLWSHIGKDEATVLGDDVTFDAIDSNRLRFGTRVLWQANSNWRPYAGLAYEWECSGTASANTQGLGIDAPCMRGSSFVGELGTVWQPNLNRPLWLDAAVQGSTGKVTGCTGKFGVTIGF